MEIHDSLIKDLNELGLSVYEAKTYLALLERNSLDTGEVSQISGVPRGRIYDVLDSLVNKGIASYKPGKLKKYSAVDIDSLRENIIANGRTEWENKEKNINRISLKLKKDISSIFPAEKRTSDPLEYIEILRNPNQIHRKFIELYSKAQIEVLGFNKPPFAYQTKAQWTEQHKVQVEAANRQIIQKTIIQTPPEDEAPAFYAHIEEHSKEMTTGTKHDGVRIIDELPIKLFVFDRKICLFTLRDPIEDRLSLTMLVTEHEAIANSFVMLFDFIWAISRDYFTLNGRKRYFDPSQHQDEER